MINYNVGDEVTVTMIIHGTEMDRPGTITAVPQSALGGKYTVEVDGKEHQVSVFDLSKPKQKS